jgi:hypothetical protein
MKEMELFGRIKTESPTLTKDGDVVLTIHANQRLFNTFTTLAHEIKELSAIVQNPETLCTVRELIDYNRQFRATIKRLEQLLNEVNAVAKP